MAWGGVQWHGEECSGMGRSAVAWGGVQWHGEECSGMGRSAVAWGGVVLQCDKAGMCNTRTYRLNNSTHYGKLWYNFKLYIDIKKLESESCTTCSHSSFQPVQRPIQ